MDFALPTQQHGRKRLADDWRERQTRCGADHCDQQAFNQQLLHQPPARGSHRQPRGQFLLPCRAPRHQETRQIQAGEQQDAATHGKYRHEWLAKEKPYVGETCRTRFGCEREMTLFLGCNPVRVRDNFVKYRRAARPNLRVCLFECRLRLQPPHHGKPPRMKSCLGQAADPLIAGSAASGANNSGRCKGRHL